MTYSQFGETIRRKHLSPLAIYSADEFGISGNIVRTPNISVVGSNDCVISIIVNIIAAVCCLASGRSNTFVFQL